MKLQTKDTAEILEKESNTPLSDNELKKVCKRDVCSRLLGKWLFALLWLLGSVSMSAQQLAAPFPIGSDSQLGNFPKRESRAVWLTTIKGLDWPKTKALSAESREKQKRELTQILDQLKAVNINTVLLQTRVRASVIYPSAIEPWDVCLTGQYNRHPGYDPLQFAIDEAHKRGMELHAWVVTIPAYKIADANKMGNGGIHVKKASIIKKHNDQFYLDPGRPETAEYLTNICAEMVEKYDLDGIHFDYIRYPENAASFNDADSYKQYGAGKSKAQWRRDNITAVVRSIYNRVKAIKPWIRVSSSPVGKFRDLQRYSSKGWNCYDAVNQDAQGWLREGIHDALYPMMYFKGQHFYPFAADWKERDYGRMVAPGLGIYFMSREEKNWPLSDITNELYFLREQGLGGQCYFRSKFLTDNTKGLYDFLQKTFYAFPALTPAITWCDSIPPTEPTNLRTESLGNGMERLTWDPATDNIQAGGVRYNIYVGQTDPVDITKAENLVASALQETSFTYNAELLKLNGLHIRVTAMDRFGNESGKEEDEADPSEHGTKFTAFYDALGSHHDAVVVASAGQNANMLTLPEQYIKQVYAVTDIQGRLLLSGMYVKPIDVSKLASGWYQVRQLHKKGSRRILEFWKKK